MNTFSFLLKELLLTLKILEFFSFLIINIKKAINIKKITQINRHVPYKIAKLNKELFMGKSFE